MATDAPRNPEADNPIGGDFLIEGLIDKGAVGRVYRARQVSLNRVVALKVLGPAINDSISIKRFEREAQAMARLKHPSIAPVYTTGQDALVCYMAMEYIEGVSFRKIIQRVRSITWDASSIEEAVRSSRTGEVTPPVVRVDIAAPLNASISTEPPTTNVSSTTELSSAFEPTPLPNTDRQPELISPAARRLIAQRSYLRRCVEMVRDVALALAHAHDQGIIHRDVKPENLILDHSDKVWVIDFGLARYNEERTITYEGQLIGTPLYMSPEQVLALRKIDFRSDIYSLGMVLYELLTLAPPIKASNLQSLFRKIATENMPPVTWKNSAVSADLAAVVHHALAKSPDERYASITDFATDLQRYLDGKSVAAPPYRYRFDEGEIFLRRPTEIVGLSHYCVVCSFVSFFYSLLSLMTFRDLKLFFYFISLSILFFMTARSTMRAGLFGQALGIITGLSIIIFTINYNLDILNFVDEKIHTTLTNILIASIFGMPLFVVLSLPRVRDWFQFAHRIRILYERQVYERLRRHHANDTQ